MTIVNTDRRLERTEAKRKINPHVHECFEKDFDERAKHVSNNFAYSG